MADITDAAIQEEIGNSILDAPIVGVLRGPAPYVEHTAEDDGDGVQDSVYADPMDYFQQEIEDEQTGIRATLKYGDAEVQDRIAKRGDRPETSAQQAPEQRQGAPRQQEQQQPVQELTPEQAQESLRAVSGVVDQYELNDHALAKDFTNGFCESFGINSFDSGTNIEQMGRTQAGSTLLAFNAYDSIGGDLSKAPAHVPPEVASAVTRDFLKSWGVDPRLENVDAQVLADTIYFGKLAIIATFNQKGWQAASLDEINSPENAELFFSRFLQAFHADPAAIRAEIGPLAFRTAALKLADAEAKYILGFHGKISSIESRQGQGARSNTGRGRGQRVPERFKQAMKGAKAPRFRTNSGPGDPFAPEIMDGWAQQTGRL